MDDPFIGSVVCVGKKRRPLVVRKTFHVNSEPVILRGNETTACVLVRAWLIDTAIAIFHFKSSETSCEREKLVPQTDSKNRFGIRFQNVTQIGNGYVTFGRVAGSIADEQSVVLLRIQREIPRHQVDARTSRKETAQLMVLEPTINCTNT